MKKKCIGFLFASAFLLLSSISFAGDGVWESSYHWVNDYIGGGCSGTDRTWGDNFEAVWDDYFTPTTGSYDYDDYHVHSDLAVDLVDWMDPTYDASGLDYSHPGGTDFADAVGFFGHSGIACRDDVTNNWKYNGDCEYSDNSYTAHLTMGDDSDSCYAYYHNNQIDLGDEDANVLVTSSCLSTDRRLWVDHAIALRADNEFNTFMGSHGLENGSSQTAGGFDDFLAGSEFDDMGLNWVVDTTFINVGYDQCGTTIIWGNTTTELSNVYNNQGFKDWKSSGSGIWGYYYVNNCAPAEAPALPS